MINKAIVLIAGPSIKFSPISKAIPREFLPLADKPAIQYLIEEAAASGVKEIIFVISPGKKKILVDYFKKSPKLEKSLKEEKMEESLKKVLFLDEISKNINFNFIIQKEPLGDGHAVLQAKKLISEPCGVFFSDDILDSNIPCLAQLDQNFKTGQKPMMALKKIQKEDSFRYGMAKTEKISSRVHKIKNILEKPKIDESNSDLAVLGRYIITPEFFDYLKKQSFDKKGKITLSETFNTMTRDGKAIYGYEVEGEWLECEDIPKWLKSNIYFSLKHPDYGNNLKQYLKSINI
jgi:UTP--glucose-1-phosphate uridylyltransferase